MHSTVCAVVRLLRAGIVSKQVIRLPELIPQYRALHKLDFACRCAIFNPLTPTFAIWVQLIRHPVPDRINPSFVIFDIRAL